MKGSAWLIMSCLVIFFFIFQWLVIYSVVTISYCHDLAKVWMVKNQDGLNLLYIVWGTFILFFLWSLADVFRAIYLNYGDRMLSVVVFLLVAAFTVYVSMALKGLWEITQIEQGFLKKEEASVYRDDWIILNPWRDEERERKIAIRLCEQSGTTYTK